MREIKFRAWDKEDEAMFEPDGILQNGKPVSIKNDEIEYIWELNEVALMQYTGLKDMNGKEIYEGDVVKADGFKQPVFQIDFIEGGFCLTQPWSHGFPLDINSMYPSYGCLIEVIGNIYENPELLK